MYRDRGGGREQLDRKRINDALDKQLEKASPSTLRNNKGSTITTVGTTKHLDNRTTSSGLNVNKNKPIEVSKAIPTRKHIGAGEMLSQHGIQLATHLISSFYGDLCSKVCECLLSKGTLTLPNIIQFSELTKDNVMNCLRILIHQNCVQAFAIVQDGAFGETPRVITNYMVLFDNIIHKLRAPKFMQIVSEELGDEGCLEIFLWLLQHGRLSMNQIVSRNNERKPGEGKSDFHVLQENFRRLLNSRFIERCPEPEPYLEPDEAPKKKRNTKLAKVVEEELTIEQRALVAACPMESVRFLMEIDDLSDEKVDEIHKGVRPGVKRKQDVMKFKDDALDANKNKEVVWRVNFEEFVSRLRHKACISCVKMWIGNEAGIVLSAILGLSRGSDRQNAKNTAYLSLNAIFDEIIKQDRGLSMDLERTKTALAQLDCQTISNDMDDSYSVDLKRIIGMAQIEEVESVVLRRYGRDAYRIFRLLMKKVQLLETNAKDQATELKGSLVETNKISDVAFVDKKDTIKILYKLWKNDYVHMEKVSTSAKPPIVLLWKVKKESLWVHVLDEMYHAALNLRLRYAHEQIQGKQALEKMENSKRAKVILQSSLIDLDDSIMLFHDF